MTIQLDLDSVSFQYYDALRTQLFPKHKLKDHAHITLLYQIHLEEREIIKRLENFDFHEFAMSVKKIKNYDTGNAINFDHKEVRILQNKLKAVFKNKLAKKDYFPYSPHLTLQLNVTNFKAQQTYQNLVLQENYPPITVKGISVWNKDKAKHVMVYQKAFNAIGAQ